MGKAGKRGKSTSTNSSPPLEGKEASSTSMRIAQDVINRVKYDPDLPTEAFVVGYEDRFVGIKEKAFTAFTWEVRYTRRGRTCVCVYVLLLLLPPPLLICLPLVQWVARVTACFDCRTHGLIPHPATLSTLSPSPTQDLAMVDDRAGDLAIPQHRIQYFKYRGHIVWDKRGVRRDDFFGSTPGGRTIHEVMSDSTLVPTCSRCTEGVPHTRTPSCTAGTAAADSRKGKNGRKQGSRRHGGGRGGSDGPRKTLPSAGGGGVGGGGGGEGKDGDERGDDDNGNGNNEHGAKNDRPNYFVSVRVAASNVRNGIVSFAWTPSARRWAHCARLSVLGTLGTLCARCVRNHLPHPTS